MNGERVTAAEAERIQRLAAAALLDRGIRSGDRFGLVARSSVAYLAVVLGGLRRGIVPVPLDPSLTGREQRRLLDDAQPTFVLHDDDLPALVAPGREVDLAPAPLARPLSYTSGTTGTPKGVWSGILDERAAGALVEEERDLWEFGPTDVNLVVSPLHHSAPLRFAAGTLLAGGTVVVAGVFDTTRLAALVASHRPTTAFMVPTHLRRLLDHPDPPPLGSFRLLAHAGAPCPAALKQRALAAFADGAVWEFYGSTEGQFTACSPDEWRARPGTVGRARQGRQLVVEPDGTIWCSVPAHARFEYWRDPARTARAWRDDAFTIGDLGRLDPDGYLFLDGRRDDLVITGGVNVYPLEVERALLEHPAVEQVAVFGVADEDWGQRVSAAVVGDVEPAILTEWLRDRLAPHKRPKLIVIVDAIPVSGTGKVRRSQLAVELGLAASDR